MMKNKRGFYDIFVRACAKYPSNVAVRFYEDGDYKCYSYSELYGVCEYLSQQLQQMQCNRGVVGLVSKTNILVPCVIAAAHKCCTVFMFLDPASNIQPIIEDMKFTIIISIMDDDDSIDSLCKKPDRVVTMFGLSICFYDYSSLSSKLNYKHSPEHSYIAMTSGSTGEPKKVQVPLQCLQPNIDDLTNLFHITQDDTIYFSTPLTFDPSMVEVLLACMNGASLLIAPPKIEALFPENGQHAVTVWQTTPSKFFQFPTCHIRHKILSAKSSLKILALGGEPMNGVRMLKELKHSSNKTKIFTLYGVTEMSCWASVAELDLNKISTDQEVPLGKCLSETKVILEPETPTVNATGKIILVSKTRKCIILSKGEELNSLKFVDTGDLGEVSNGTIYYRGRKDDVIKRFGHKVNLQFIESTVMHCPRIKSCSCIWLPKPQLLVVYFSSESFSSQDLSDFLKCKLDDKHWPDRIVRVDNMPITHHGKISKSILTKMIEKVPTASTSAYQLKARFLEEMRSLLGPVVTYDQIKDKTFSKLGGSSFLAVTVCNNISITNPDFGKFLLPHLINEKKSIDQILDMAEKEVCCVDVKPKKRLRIDKQSTSECTKSTTSDLLEARPCHSMVCHSLPDSVEFLVMWTYNTGKCVDASPSLLRTGLNLYVTVGSHSGFVVTVDAMTGFIVGTIDMKSRVEASVFCYSSDPVIPPCGIVGSYDGTLACYTIETSEEIWRTNVGTMIKSKATVCNGFVYVASYDGIIRSIDLMTGKIKNSVMVAEQPISADLVLAKNEYILTGTLSGVCASVHTATNTVVWRGTLDSPVFASPALYDDDKYVVFAEVSGEIHCRTVEKGIKIWKYSGAKGNIFSSIHIREVDKHRFHMVFGCHDNNIYCLNVKNFQPSLHWKVQLSSPVYSTPCGLTDKLLLAASSNGKLAVINCDHGVVLSEYCLPNETFSSPAVYGDYIFIGCRDDLVYALKFVPNDPVI